MPCKVKTLEARYWAHVKIGASPSACWAWTGAKTEHGYGRIGVGGRGAGVERAHRVSWTIHFGPIPAGMFVCHECDNPECSNPKHLFLGDQDANMRDCVAKNRHRAVTARESYSSPNMGRPRGTSKYSDAACRVVRKLLADGRSHREIAASFGVSKSMVPLLAARGGS